MFSIWTLVTVTVIYMLLLFVLASVGNRAKRLPKSVYSLALGIHCTSWAFFGTTTQAAQFGWPLVPTYLGVILVMLFGFKLFLRVNAICKQYKVSSIAEFISIRYEHSNLIASIVTFICVIGVIPYIALQLDAIKLALSLLLSDTNTLASSSSLSLYITLGMAAFAIWFGARKMNLTDRNAGLMLTIAAQSLVKLIAMLMVGLFVVYSVFDGFVDLFEQSIALPETRELIDSPFAFWIYLSHALLGICSMFCLPRQFHVNFVENRNDEEIHQARWLFPSYLIGMSLFVLPIALAGTIIFNPSNAIQSNAISNVSTSLAYTTDSFVLAIPIVSNMPFIAIIAFIGGLAASTSMVIVATLALGNMVANSLITPLFLVFNTKKLRTVSNVEFTQDNNETTSIEKPSKPSDNKVALRLSSQAILRTRQLTILFMLLIAYAYHINISQQMPLVQTGTIALSLLSQTFPAIVLGIFWHRASRLGATFGIVLGIATVIFGMLIPSINQSITSEALAYVLFISFAINTSSIVVVSLFTPLNTAKLPSNDNPYASSALQANSLVTLSGVRLGELVQLIDRVLPIDAATSFRQQVLFVSSDASTQSTVTTNGQNQAETLTEHLLSETDVAPANVVTRAEKLLAAHMGSASTRILLKTISNQSLDAGNDLSELAAQAGKNFQFNHKVLQASITHLPLGISVIDADFNLVAWNAIYEALFDYPKDYLQVGKPIIEILQYNAQRGLLGTQNSQSEIQKRMQNMLTGKSYKAVRPQLHNKVVEISGNPLPAGGYISCYSDITEYINIQNQLETAKLDLEQRVERRTHQLEVAKVEAEQANIGKTKFLAATSHDLMQPLNAASLFASMLHEKLQGKGEFELADNLVNSLDNAESLLNMLIDITKLENKRIKPNLQSFKLDDLLSQLVSEFSLLAQEKSIKLVYVKTNIWVNTDRRLLSRVIQNLLSNAIRYTHKGKILIGVRRKQPFNNTKLCKCDLLVADTGDGIADENQSQIFNEFKRLDPQDSHQGLGLGLTIVDKISELLDYKIRLQSALDKGSVFTIELNRTAELTQNKPSALMLKKSEDYQFLRNKHVLVLENDEAVLSALVTLLESWGAKVITAHNQSSADDLLKNEANAAHMLSLALIIADYHLDNGDTGVTVALTIQNKLEVKTKTILSSADRSEGIQALAYEHEMQYLPKPIKQAALKRLIQRIL